MFIVEYLDRDSWKVVNSYYERFDAHTVMNINIRKFGNVVWRYRKVA